MSNILNFEKKTSSEKELERVRAEYNARPSKAIAGTFNPDMLADSMARLLLNLGDEINMLGFELMSDSRLFAVDRLSVEAARKLEQKLYRWDRRLVELQERFYLLDGEPIDCYLDAQYPEGMSREHFFSWLEKCTAQLELYWLEIMSFNPDIAAQNSRKWDYFQDLKHMMFWSGEKNEDPDYLTVGQVGRLILGNYQESDIYQV